MDLRLFLTKRKILSVFFVVLLLLFFYIVIRHTLIIPDGPTPLNGPKVEAMFYVENSSSGSTTCVGDGLIRATGNIYGDEDAVSELIVSAPDYSNYITSDMTIKWYSIKQKSGEYQVVGAIRLKEYDPDEKATYVFDNVDELKSARLKAGTTAKTKGFYSPSDGGGALYNISSSKTQIDDMFRISLKNGLCAALDINSDYVNVDQLGAKGDGVSDDVKFIQAAFNSGFNVTLGEGKEYKLVSNGLTIKHDMTLNGNNSILVIDDSYAPTSSGCKKFLIRTGANPLDDFAIHNLGIDCRITQRRYSGSNYLCILQPLCIKNVTLNNVGINVRESNNKIVDFWLYTGCDNLIMDGCNFGNDTLDLEGGIIFLKSDTDARLTYFNSFKNISITNCHFKGHCSDEAIAIWGPNDVNFTMASSTLEWTHKRSDHLSRAINIACHDNTNPTYDILFKDCDIIVDSPTADSAVGIGSLYPNNMNVSFEGCTFDAKVKDSFLHFQLLQKTPEAIERFKFGDDKYNINFDSCKINCSKTIVGSNSFYNSDSTLNWAIDSTFTKCDINCNYAFALLSRFSKTEYYYVPTIVVDNCTVNVDNAIGFIYKTNYAALADIEIKDSNVHSSDLKQLSTFRYKDKNGTGITQSKVSEVDTAVSNSKLNSVNVSK